MSEGRACTKCGEFKPMADFSVAQNMVRKDGSTYKKYRARCKLCLRDQRAMHNKAWREKNLDEVRAKARERYRLKNPPKEPKPKRTIEEAREYQRNYYAANKDKYKAYMQKYYEKNKAAMAANVKKWIAENKERHNETRLKWREQNRERICEQQKANVKKWFLKNPDKIRHARQEKKRAMKAKDPQAWNEKMRRYNSASQKRMVAELTDAYVRQRLARENDGSPRKISAKDIPQGLVDAKRIQLMILRTLRNEKC